MERQEPYCHIMTHKSFQRRMEERSELLKQRKGTQKVAVAQEERPARAAVDELDHLHRKWKHEQFHFDHRAESAEQRDEDAGVRENLTTSDTLRSSLNLKARKHRRRMRVSFMEQSINDNKCSPATAPLHLETTNKTPKDAAVANLWKEKQLDKVLEGMILKLQKQSDSKGFDKAKEEKLKKLQSLLIEIKHKMAMKLSDPTNSQEIDRYAAIPKDIIAEMQKLLSAHKHTGRGPRGRCAVHRLPTTSILDSIPENASIDCTDERTIAKADPRLTVKKQKSKEERLRRLDKQSHTLVEGMVNRAVDCFGCGKMSDLVPPQRKLGSKGTR